MTTKTKILQFEWDRGNREKSYEKHGITPKEAEEVFICEDLYVEDDLEHSQIEKRFIAFGKSQSQKHLFVVFTMRMKKIRIISARLMNRKEVARYEKAQKDTTL